MINRKISLGIFFSIISLTICTVSYAEDFQSASLTDTQQATDTNAPQSPSHDQETRERRRLAREAEREREAQQRQEAQIARQNQIDDIMRHSHDVTAPQSFNPTESNYQTEQINSTTVSTTQDQTNKTTSTLPKLLVLLVLIALAIFWLKNSRKTPQATTYRNKTKRTSSRQNTNRRQDHSQQKSSHTQQEPQLQTSDRVQIILNDFYSENPQIQMAYRQPLNDIHLYFSVASLHRLDQVLFHIKNANLNFE